VDTIVVGQPANFKVGPPAAYASPASASRQWRILRFRAATARDSFPATEISCCLSWSVAAVPEPSTLTLFAVGLMGLLTVGNQTRKRRTRIS